MFELSDTTLGLKFEMVPTELWFVVLKVDFLFLRFQNYSTRRKA